MNESLNAREDLARLGYADIDEASLHLLDVIAKRYGQLIGGVLVLDPTAFPEQARDIQALIAATPTITSVIKRIRGTMLGADFENLLRQLQPKAAASRTVASAPLSHADTRESMEAAEHAHIRKAVDTAVARGIVREEVFASPDGNARHGYLWSGRHYKNGQYDPVLTLPETKLSQAQFFQLVYLIQQSGSSSPLYVEGRTKGHSYKPFLGQRPLLSVNGNTVDVHDPLAQRAMFENSGAIIAVYDHIQREAKRFSGAAPCFYPVTTYPHIVGAQTEETAALMDKMGWYAEWEESFLRRYERFFSLVTAHGIGNIPIPTGWTPGATEPLLELAEEWHPIAQVEEDIRMFFEYMDFFQAFDERREDEMAECMRETTPGLVPMAFAGKGHEFGMISRLQPSMHLHVLTATASLSSDPLRKSVPHNDPTNPRIIFMRALEAVIQKGRTMKPLLP